MHRNPARESLFESWLDTHRGIIFKVTQAYARSPREGAELQQEIKLQLWNSLSTYSGEAKASTWIYRVSLNAALAWRRSANRRESKIEPGADLNQVPGLIASPADAVDQRDLLDKLYEAIRAMNEFDRALVLLMLDGLAYGEIAVVTGLTENHVGVALTRARKHLAALMKGVIDELE